MNPVTVFGSISTELTKKYNLPFTVTACIKALTVVHWVWWFRRKGELTKAENIIPAALGTGLDLLTKIGPKVLRITILGIAKIILLATRIDECREKMQDLAKAFGDLKNACTGKFLPLIEPRWIKAPESIVLSAHSINAWNRQGHHFISRIKRIYYCLLNIFTEVFKLGMHTWDVYHAIVFNHDDIPEMFVNGMKWWRKIRDNKEYFYKKLSENEALIQSIFTAMHVPAKLTAHRLIKSTKTIFEKMDAGVLRIEKVNKAVGEKIIQGAKKVKNLVVRFFSIKSLKLADGANYPAHTPFTERKLPNIAWATPAFTTIIASA